LNIFKAPEEHFHNNLDKTCSLLKYNKKVYVNAVLRVITNESISSTDSWDKKNDMHEMYQKFGMSAVFKYMELFRN